MRPPALPGTASVLPFASERSLNGERSAEWTERACGGGGGGGCIAMMMMMGETFRASKIAAGRMMSGFFVAVVRDRGLHVHIHIYRG